MEQCEWCGIELYTLAQVYMGRRGAITMRVCQECVSARWEGITSCINWLYSNKDVYYTRRRQIVYYHPSKWSWED